MNWSERICEMFQPSVHYNINTFLGSNHFNKWHSPQNKYFPPLVSVVWNESKKKKNILKSVIQLQTITEADIFVTLGIKTCSPRFKRSKQCCLLVEAESRGRWDVTAVKCVSKHSQEDRKGETDRQRERELECKTKKTTREWRENLHDGWRRERHTAQRHRIYINIYIYMEHNEKQLFSFCRQTQHLQINCVFPILSCLFLSWDNRMDKHGCSLPDVGLNFPPCQSTPRLSPPSPPPLLLSPSAFFQHRSLLLENTNDLSATISPSSHQYLISCTGRNSAWIILLEAICRYN